MYDFLVDHSSIKKEDILNIQQYVMIKMVFRFIVSSSSLARVAELTKCLFLNGEPCMVRPTIIDMNPVELKYYPFMISLNKCSGSCNVISKNTCSERNKSDKY